MPVITTLGALSARGFGTGAGSSGGFWWDSFALGSPYDTITAGLDNQNNPVVIANGFDGSIGFIQSVKLTRGGAVRWQFRDDIDSGAHSLAVCAPVLDASNNIFVLVDGVTK